MSGGFLDFGGVSRTRSSLLFTARKRLEHETTRYEMPKRSVINDATVVNRLWTYDIGGCSTCEYLRRGRTRAHEIHVTVAFDRLGRETMSASRLRPYRKIVRVGGREGPKNENAKNISRIKIYTVSRSLYIFF